MRALDQKKHFSIGAILPILFISFFHAEHAFFREKTIFLLYLYSASDISIFYPQKQAQRYIHQFSRAWET